MKKLISILALAAAATAAVAQTQEPSVRFYSSAGVSFGGDELAKGSYTDGSSFSIKAGSGLMLNVGVAVGLTDKVDGVLTVGYHSASTSATNGNVAFKRTPVELLGFYALDQNWRLGGGLRSASSAQLSGSGVASNVGTNDFSNSVGTVLEVQYLMEKNSQSRSRWGFSGRYVLESFEEKSTKISVNGNHLGLSVIFMY